MHGTPEYIRAHMGNLDSSVGSGDAARHRAEIRARDRRERRERLLQYAVAIGGWFPFASRTNETGSVASIEATEMT